MNVELHIERLVVEGIDLLPGERDLFRENVRSELVRLFQDAEVRNPQIVSGAVHSVHAPSIDLPAGAPAELGRRVAVAIHGGVLR